MTFFQGTLVIQNLTASRTDASILGLGSILCGDLFGGEYPALTLPGRPQGGAPLLQNTALNRMGSPPVAALQSVAHDRPT